MIFWFFNLLDIFKALEQGEKATVDYCNAWNSEVVAHVPKEKLLVYEVKEGWEPLCNFLGLPKPDIPFPHANETAAMSGLFDRLRFYSKLFLLGLPLAVAMLAMLLWQVWLKCNCVTLEEKKPCPLVGIGWISWSETHEQAPVSYPEPWTCYS